MTKRSDGVYYHHDMGRGLLSYRTDITRYGVEQRSTKWHPDGQTDWYSGWPSYASRSDAESSLRYYADADRGNSRPKYEHRICVYPPEPPPFAYRLERL